MQYLVPTILFRVVVLYIGYQLHSTQKKNNCCIHLLLATAIARNKVLLISLHIYIYTSTHTNDSLKIATIVERDSIVNSLEHKMKVTLPGLRAGSFGVARTRMSARRFTSR